MCTKNKQLSTLFDKLENSVNSENAEDDPSSGVMIKLVTQHRSSHISKNKILDNRRLVMNFMEFEK